MKPIIISLVALALGVGQSFASTRTDLLVETFGNVDGSMEAAMAADQSQFDISPGWTLTPTLPTP